MPKNNCLNCKYEPNWPDPVGKTYPRRTADCQWNKPMPPLPGVIKFIREPVTRYSDNSGIIENCKAWEPK